MAIRHKRKATGSYTWLTGDLVEGQIGINLADGTLHIKKGDTTIATIQDSAATDAAYEPLDATILKDADIGVNVQAYDATIVVDADIGVTVQGYDANTALTSDITYETLNTNGDVGTSAGTLAIGDHSHEGTAIDATAITDGYVLTADGAGNAAWEVSSGGIANIVEDTTPQLGGSLDVNGQSIVSVSAGDIAITPDTTGDVIIDGLKWPQADGTADYMLTTDGSGQLSWVSPLHEISTLTDITAATPVAGPGTHRYWAINVTNNFGGSHVAIAELELYDTFGGSTVTGSGTASAAGGTPADAFDGNLATWWIHTGVTSSYIAYDFGSGNDKAIIAYSIGSNSNGAGGAIMPYDFTLQYSDNGVDFTVYDTQTDITFAPTEVKYFYPGSDYQPNGYMTFDADTQKWVLGGGVGVVSIDDQGTNGIAMVINSAGAVKISDTQPRPWFTDGHAFQVDDNFTIWGDGTDSYLSNNTYYAPVEGWYYIATAPACQIKIGDSSFQVLTAASGTTVTEATMVPRFDINNTTGLITIGGDFDTGGKVITSNSNADIAITPDGSGKTKITNPELYSTVSVKALAGYTLVLTDASWYIAMSYATANTLTVPPNSSVAFPVGVKVEVEMRGAGITTLVAGSGVTINTRNTLALAGQYGVATLIKTATDTWTAYGDLT